MATPVSPLVMVERLEPLLGTRDLTVWEEGFLRTIVARRDAGDITKLTTRQFDVLTRLHDKHFA